MNDERRTQDGRAVLSVALDRCRWDASLAERRRRAFEYRQMRWPYRKIADELGISVGCAHADVQMVLDALLPVEDAEALRRQEADNLDRIEAVLLERFAAKGEVTVVDRILAVQQRRSKLLGLDAPSEAKVEHSGTVSISSAEQVARIRDELSERRERRAG